MFKKILALSLVLLLGFGLISCGKNDLNIPEGMQSATLEGEPFSLFVPQNWTPNLSSGTSSAYVSSNNTVMVSARYFLADDGMTLDAYLSEAAEGYAATYDSFEQTALDAAVLGGEDAMRLSFKITKNETVLTCFQISTLWKGDLVSLFAYCDEKSYDTYKEDFDRIVKEFRLGERSAAQAEPVLDKHTPENMKIASGEDLEYVLYVPTTWVCNPANGMSEAYFPESEKSNLSVTSYVPEGTLTVEDYFADCEKQYKTIFADYTRLSESKRTVAEREAISYRYTFRDGDRTACVMQTLFSYNEMIYSITYVALEEKFDTHLDDVEAILNAFRFR